MTSITLSEAEIQAITGYVQPAGRWPSSTR